MASCTQIDGWIQAYLDGELTASERVILEQHVGDCQACASLYRQHQRTSAFLFESLSDSRLHKSLTKTVMEHLPERTPTQLDAEDVETVNWRAKQAAKARWQARVARSIPIAIGLLLVLGAFILKENWPAPPPSSEAVGVVAYADRGTHRIVATTAHRESARIGAYVEKGDTFETSHDGKFLLQLAGPTMVKARENTRLKVLDYRNLRIDKGRTFLSVTKGDRLFRIFTPSGDVTVYGTTFELDVTESRTQVTVANGVVMLERGAVFSNVEDGQRATIKKGDSDIKTQSVYAADVVAWADGITADSEASALFASRFGGESLVLLGRKQGQVISLPEKDTYVDSLTLSWESDPFTRGHCGYLVYVRDNNLDPMFRVTIPGSVFDSKNNTEFRIDMGSHRNHKGALHLIIIPDSTGRETEFDLVADVAASKTANKS